MYQINESDVTYKILDISDNWGSGEIGEFRKKDKLPKTGFL